MPGAPCSPFSLVPARTTEITRNQWFASTPSPIALAKPWHSWHSSRPEAAGRPVSHTYDRNHQKSMVCINPLPDSTGREGGIVAPKSGINAKAQHPWGRRLPTAPEHQRQPDVELGRDQGKAASRGLHTGGVRLPRVYVRAGRECGDLTVRGVLEAKGGLAAVRPPALFDRFEPWPPVQLRLGR